MLQQLSKKEKTWIKKQLQNNVIIFRSRNNGHFRKHRPAFRYNLISRTPAYKDFHCNRG